MFAIKLEFLCVSFSTRKSPCPLHCVEKTMQKPHALCLPFPTQGHITPMLHLAKLLHSRGFHITFVNTEFNHHRLIKSAALDPTVQMDGFMFERIPDGLPAQEINATQSIPELCASVTKNCSAPLRQLVMRLNGEKGAGGPPVSLMVRDAVMICGQKVADDLNIPDVVLWTMSTYTMMGFFQFEELVRRGYTPFTGTQLDPCLNVREGFGFDCFFLCVWLWGGGWGRNN